MLVKARTGTLEVKARVGTSRTKTVTFIGVGEETIEHFIVECCRYERQRGRLIETIMGIISESEWQTRR